MPHLVVKTEGNSVVGLGHVSRISSVVRSLPANWGHQILVTANDTVEAFLREQRLTFKVQYTQQDLDVADVVIFDQQTEDTNFLQMAASKQIRICGLDYYNYESPFVNVFITLINQNSAENFPEEKVEFYEGLEYAIIAPKFIPLRTKKKQKADIENVLIVFGGADQTSNTLKALAFLSEVRREMHVKVVVGPLARLPKLVESDRHRVDVHYAPANLPEIMAWADVAFSGSGTTSFELGFLGIPNIVMPQNAAELRLAERMAAAGNVVLGKNLEQAWFEIEQQGKRESLVEKAQIIFDGQGIQRIFDRIGIS